MQNKTAESLALDGHFFIFSLPTRSGIQEVLFRIISAWIPPLELQAGMTGNLLQSKSHRNTCGDFALPWLNRA